MNHCSKENCIGWKNCLGFEWWDYGEICWCPFQNIWIIENAGTFSQGIWPEHPIGEVDAPSQLPEEGRFTLACETVAEVCHRLNKVGKRRAELLIQEIDAGKQFAKTIDRMSDEARSILLYISGWQRKKMTYSAWLKQRKYRNGSQNS